MEKVRQSNFELLRILAMLMVVVGHTQFVALGRPSISAFNDAPLDLCVRCIIQYLCLPCVNIFILISGFFGIHPKVKGLVNLAFQVVFYSGLCYLLLLLFGRVKLSFKGVTEVFGLTNAFWFFKSYLLLYILAPVLNSFSETAGRTQFKFVLIGFFLFQTVFGWYLHTAHFFQTGMSTVSFIGLYLLGRYIFIFHPRFTEFGRNVYLIIYLLFTLVLVAFTVVLPHFLSTDQEHIYASLYLPLGYFSSPIVIIQALALFLLFASFRFTNLSINRLASCSFAIYLMHQRTEFIPIWKSFIGNLHSNYSLLTFYLLIVGIVLVYFFVCVILDRIRLSIWEKVSLRIS